MVILFYGSLIALWIILFYALTSFVSSFIIPCLNLSKKKFAGLLLLNRKFSLALIILLIVLANIRETFFYTHINWHPSFAKEDIVGIWKKANTYLTFDSNGVMHCHGKYDVYSENQDYYWDFVKENSIITTKNVERKIVKSYQLIMFFNEYRMLDEYNPDESLKLGFSKIE